MHPSGFGRDDNFRVVNERAVLHRLPHTLDALPMLQNPAPFPTEQLRADTRGCETQVFFNNAGASLPPRQVVDRVVTHLRREEEIGGYEAAAEIDAELEQVYGSIATLLNAHPNEIALTESATRAWDMAFYALPWQQGDVIVTAPNEYASNYIAFLQVVQRFGVRVEVISSDPTGAIDLTALEESLNRERQVRLIALTHVPTNNGRVQPAAEVGKLARQHGVPFLLDACQSAGQLPLDVEALGSDLLSGTGRKYLRGPRGTGFLYVRRSLLDRLDPPMLDMHAADWTGPDTFRMRDDARRFETWESSISTRLGLGVAVHYALNLGLEAIATRVQALARLLREGLASVRDVTVQDIGWSEGAQQCGIVTFSHNRLTPDSLVARMREGRFVIRSSDRGSALLDMDARRLDAVARASVHYYNTEDEIARFVQAIEQV